MDTLSIIKTLLVEKSLTQKALTDYLGISKNAFTNWSNGSNTSYIKHLPKIAEFFNVSVDYLLGRDSKEEKFKEPVITSDVVTFPVLGKIAAGYDSIAVEDWGSEIIEIPKAYLKGRDRSEFFVLEVKGDSMYPEYREGDKVLVLKQTTLNTSGTVGAVLYDGDYATLKKVTYAPGEDWLELSPINPMYPPKRIEGADLERCRIIGIPKLLIRDIG